MNRAAILAGIGGLVIGVAGGYTARYLIDKKNLDRLISEGIQQTLDEIKGNQKKIAMENEDKKSQIINAIPHFTAVDIAKEIATDNGYIKPEAEDVKEPDEAPDDDESDLPFEFPKEGELEKHNIWDDKEEDDNSVTQEEYDSEVGPDMTDISKLDPNKLPYPISKDQFDNELLDEVEQGMWDKVSLIFFVDNVFAERAMVNEFDVMNSMEVEAAIGKSNMKSFIENKSLGRAFVRNNRLHIDYEIVRSPRTYASALREDDDEE